MVETEIAFADLEDILTWPRPSSVFDGPSAGKPPAELATLERNIGPPGDDPGPFPRLTYTEALEMLAAGGP